MTDADYCKPTKWWRAIDADGKVLAETSDPEDFETLELIGKRGVTFQRLYERRLDEWVEEKP
jgi:hypothetical protein